MYIILLKKLVCLLIVRFEYAFAESYVKAHTHTHNNVLHERNVWRYIEARHVYLRVRDTTK